LTTTLKGANWGAAVVLSHLWSLLRDRDGHMLLRCGVCLRKLNSQCGESLFFEVHWVGNRGQRSEMTTSVVAEENVRLSSWVVERKFREDKNMQFYAIVVQLPTRSFVDLNKFIRGKRNHNSSASFSIFPTKFVYRGITSVVVAPLGQRQRLDNSSSSYLRRRSGKRFA